MTDPTEIQGVRVVLNDGSKWIVPFVVNDEPEFGTWFEENMSPTIIEEILSKEPGSTVEVVTLPFDEYYDGASGSDTPSPESRMFANYLGMPELVEA